MSILKTVNKFKVINKIIVSMDKFHNLKEIQDTCEKLGIKPAIVLDMNKRNHITFIGKSRYLFNNRFVEIEETKVV